MEPFWRTLYCIARRILDAYQSTVTSGPNPDLRCCSQVPWLISLRTRLAPHENLPQILLVINLIGLGFARCVTLPVWQVTEFTEIGGVGDNRSVHCRGANLFCSRAGASRWQLCQAL